MLISKLGCACVHRPGKQRHTHYAIDQGARAELDSGPWAYVHARALPALCVAGPFTRSVIDLLSATNNDCNTGATRIVTDHTCATADDVSARINLINNRRVHAIQFV